MKSFLFFTFVTWATVASLPQGQQLNQGQNQAQSFPSNDQQIQRNDQGQAFSGGNQQDISNNQGQVFPGSGQQIQSNDQGQAFPGSGQQIQSNDQGQAFPGSGQQIQNNDQGQAILGGGQQLQGQGFTGAVNVVEDTRNGPVGANYSNSLQLDNGVTFEESGTAGSAGQANVRGSFSFTAPDGTPVQVSYVADENGFQPQSDFIPAMPAHVQEQLRIADEQRAQGITFDERGFQV